MSSGSPHVIAEMSSLKREALSSQVVLTREKLTLAGEVRPKPLRRGVVEETLGVGEAYSEVSGVTSVLENCLQRELGSISWAIVRTMLDTWRMGAVH